jgi:hypothetical protein
MFASIKNVSPLFMHWFGVAVLFGTGLLLPQIASAQALDVQFAATPLFLEANVVPGDNESRTVMVTNNGSTTEAIITTVKNEFDGGLGNAMTLHITSGGNTYFNNTFTQFFSAGEVNLDTLAPNNSRTYTFTAALPTTTGNPYQEKELGFDLVIGFAGGEQVTDGEDGNGGGRGNRGGGSGSGGSTTFFITNENVTVDGQDATVTWDTNRPGTTYLVCGLTENGPFRLTRTSPFGYEYRIPENPTLVIGHGVTQSDLLPGEYECLPVSRPDTDGRFTTGDPVQFIIAGALPLVAGAATSTPQTLPPARPHGSVLGVSGKGSLGGPTYEEWRAELDKSRGTTTHITTSELGSTTAIASSGERHEDTTSSALANEITSRPFFWGIIALLLGLLAILGTRRFAKR